MLGENAVELSLQLRANLSLALAKLQLLADPGELVRDSVPLTSSLASFVLRGLGGHPGIADTTRLLGEQRRALLHLANHSAQACQTRLGLLEMRAILRDRSLCLLDHAERGFELLKLVDRHA